MSAWFWKGAAHHGTCYTVILHTCLGVQDVALDLIALLPHNYPLIEQVYYLILFHVNSGVVSKLNYFNLHN